MIEAPVVICMLGQFRLFKAGKQMAVREGSKTQRLLGHLALNPAAGVRRESIVSALWPERQQSLASQSLNSLVYAIHQLLGDGIGGAPPIVQASGYCRLNIEAGIAVDLAYFESLTEEGNRLAEANDPEGAARTYRQAVGCYRGDLAVDGDIGVLIERERFRSAYLTLLAFLADRSFELGDYGGCLDYAVRLLGQDPCREDAHRLAMRCHVRRGERAQALRQYRICEEILDNEFQTAPEPATRSLFDQVRSDPSAV